MNYILLVMKNTEAIKEAIAVIIAEGRKSFVDPNSASEADAFAMGISAVESDSNFMIEATASHLEDWNHHTDAAALRAML